MYKWFFFDFCEQIFINYLLNTRGFFDNEFDDTMVKEINDRCKKYNDTNNNDKPESGSKNDDENDKDNDVDGERVENADAGKASKNDDNFNFEEFLKAENITDLLSVSFSNLHHHL